MSISQLLAEYPDVMRHEVVPLLELKDLKALRGVNHLMYDVVNQHLALNCTRESQKNARFIDTVRKALKQLAKIQFAFPDLCKSIKDLATLRFDELWNTYQALKRDAKSLEHSVGRQFQNLNPEVQKRIKKALVSCVDTTVKNIIDKCEEGVFCEMAIPRNELPKTHVDRYLGYMQTSYPNKINFAVHIFLPKTFAHLKTKICYCVLPAHLLKTIKEKDIIELKFFDDLTKSAIAKCYVKAMQLKYGAEEPATFPTVPFESAVKQLTVPKK